MRHALMLATLLAIPGVGAGQAPSVLHVTVTLLDEGQASTPVPRHALLVSDNPATSAPRRVLTAVDGTVDITLRPGSYTIESDRPAAFLGKAYQWTETVEIVAGRNAALALTAQNAEVVPLTASSAETGTAAPGRDPMFQVGKWQESIVAVWSPTTRASSFLVDARGLIVTHGSAVGRATSVEVQLSPTLKVPGRVLVSDASRDVAIVWVDPSVAARAPVPLPCAPAAAPTLDDGQEVLAMATSPRGPAEPVEGEVTALHPRAVETDMRLSFGGAGGPVFNEAGVVVGLTSVQPDAGSRQRSEVTVVRVGLICEAVSAAQSKMAGAAPPQPTPLPVEPTRPYRADAATTSTERGTGAATPPVASSSDFDVAFITPGMLSRAEQRSDWTGGRSGRSPEVEARIGRLTDFGAWADYFADAPAVLIVRVTPKMVEGFWKRIGREAARTQGAELPAFKDFKTGFLRMRATCGGAEVTPIHPFVLEHAVAEKDVVREGLYVFDAGAFGRHCGAVTLSLYSEKAPEQADTITIDPKVIDRLWQDFAPYRASGR